MPGRKFSASNGYRYGFNGQDKSDDVTQGNYTAMFWEYDTRIGRRWNLDPKPTFGLSQYSTFSNNPIWFSDPLGDTTFVNAADKNGNYKVTGGTRKDNDNSIFIRVNGKVGAKIGYSATPESFFNSDEDNGKGKWMGNINPRDQSGRNFLNKQILEDAPNIASYVNNASGGEKFDFKRTNGTEKNIFETPNEFYRGMPLSLKSSDPSLPVYGSARDVGNIAAGLVAGRAGLPWSVARFGFDFLETKQQFGATKATLFYPFFGIKAIEGSSTQFGQRLGFRVGSEIRHAEKQEQSRRMPGNGGLPKITISNHILIRSDYTPWK